jgi:hypothetical protein
MMTAPDTAHVPGDRLRRFCARVCSQATLERVIDPALSDLQIEYRRAWSQGEVWRSRWILLGGYITFVKLLIACAGERVLKSWREGEWTPNDDRAFGRTMAISIAVILTTIVVIVHPPLRGIPQHLVIYLIPQTIPFAIPLGVTIGVFCGLRGSVISARLRAAVLALALLCTAMSFATMVWVMPPADRAFRAEVGWGGRTKNPNEMTLSELRERIDEFDRAGWPRAAHAHRLAYEMRWAIPCATCVLTLFALSAVPRWRRARTWMLAVVGFGAWLAYFFLLQATHDAAVHRAMPIVLAVWLPNLLFITAAIAFVAVGRIIGSRRAHSELG